MSVYEIDLAQSANYLCPILAPKVFRKMGGGGGVSEMIITVYRYVFSIHACSIMQLFEATAL